jgi:alkanesulfonate monooxygenase SsuD/methylene tetrahydromethanopterin reductase-like flavin-dependent oxidoreductase (luciferase family)
MSAEVGLFLPQLRMDFPTIEARVRLADELGFHSVWFMDHLTPPAGPGYDCFEGWTVAAALARLTERIRLGHLVLCDAFRHPALLAKMAATLDVITEGRLELGLGWGSVPAEIERFGFGEATNRERAARLDETLQILDLMFAGGEFDFDGEYFTLRGAIGRPRPTAGSVPIHLGGAGEQLTLPLVARHADWWNCPSYAVDRIDELRPKVGGARLSVQHPVGLAAGSSPRGEVVALANRRFGAWGGLIAGTPDEVAAALRAEVDRGVELFTIPFSDFAQPETLRLFAAEVLPALRD